MKVDWTKPVQISMDLHEWITPDFTCPLDNGDALIVWKYNGKQRWGSFSGQSEYMRNTPAAPKVVPWTLSDALGRWACAFRHKGKNR